MQAPIDSIQNLAIDHLIDNDSLKKIVINTVNELDLSKEPEIMPYVIQLIDTLIWPLVVLIVLWAFKREFGGIFSRAKSLKMGASGIEIETFEKALQKTRSIATTVASAAGISKSFSPPPDPFGPTDPRMRISKLQLDLYTKLRKKAQSKSISLPEQSDIKGMNAILLSNKVISNEESQLIEGLNTLVEIALKADDVTRGQADQLLELFNKLP